MTENDQVQSQEPRTYVVLEMTTFGDVLTDVLEGLELSDEQWAAVEQDGVASRVVYLEAARLPSRNAGHALSQAGRLSARPSRPLVAVSERMFRPRQVTVEYEPKVSVA